VTDKSETIDHAPRSDSLESQPESSPAKNGVFLMKAKGQSLEEFKEFCIQRFKEAGLIKEDP